MYYYTYEIFISDPTSSLNGKYYYGKHETTKLDDNYFGSGRLILRYINKHGTSKLIKTILQFFNNRHDLNHAEYLLVKEKKSLLGDDCINMRDGGYGGHWVEYADEQEYERRCKLVRDGVKDKTSSFDRSIRAKNAGLAKRNATPEVKALWSQHYKEAHSNRDPEYKEAIYDKVSSSLKSYYANASANDLEERRRKNKESNKESSRLWRSEFYDMFHVNPEYFRKYGKMKSAIDLYKNIRNLDKGAQKNEIDRFMESVDIG